MSVTINQITVPVVPEVPKTVSSEQLFVYVNKDDARAGTWYFGSSISGDGSAVTNTIIPTSGISNAIVGDAYMNVSDTSSRGNIYTCVVAGDANTAQWSYVGNVTCVKSEYNDSDSTVSYTLQNYTQYTFSGAVSSMSITIPDTSYQGFSSEVDFVTSSTGCSFNITNNSSKQFNMLYKGWPIDNYTPAAGKEVRMLFNDNGHSILCVIVEI